MTVNGVIGLILRFSPISISLLAKYVAVVEYRPILSVNIVSQFQFSTLQRGLSAIAELLVIFCRFGLTSQAAQSRCTVVRAM